MLGFELSLKTRFPVSNRTAPVELDARVVSVEHIRGLDRFERIILPSTEILSSAVVELVIGVSQLATQTEVS